MSDLIKQQAVIDKLNEIQKGIIQTSECYTSTVELVEAIDYIQQEIYELPTVEAKPVHGEWIYKSTYYEADECDCSLCGQHMTTQKGKRMNFCPNCGADMKKKVQDE